LTTKVKTIITSINMVDVNVTTHNMTIEEQVFKDRKLKKNKFAILGSRRKVEEVYGGNYTTNASTQSTTKLTYSFN